MREYAAFRRNSKVKHEVNCWKPVAVSAAMVISSQVSLRRERFRDYLRMESSPVLYKERDEAPHPAISFERNYSDSPKETKSFYATHKKVAHKSAGMI